MKTELLCCECIAALVNAGWKPLATIYGANNTPWQTGTCSKCGKQNETLAPYPVGDLKIKGPIGPAGEPVHFDKSELQDDVRVLKATLPSIEFGAVQWAARKHKRRLANGMMGAIPLADFLREAVLEKVRAVVKAETGKGKPVPPDIAAVIDRLR